MFIGAIKEIAKYSTCVFVLQLSKPAKLNANVQPATLPDDSTPPLKYDTCTVSGWGVTQIYSSYLSPVLRAVNVKIVPSCNYYYWWMITPNMICAGSRMGGKDSCQVLDTTFLKIYATCVMHVINDHIASLQPKQSLFRISAVGFE